MDVVALTRELGKGIQADERYKKFQEAKKAVDEDVQLKLYTEKMNAIQQKFQEETEKDAPSEAVMNQIQEEYQQVYGNIVSMPCVAAFEAAQKELDGMMDHITQILYLCVSGEDPETCEPNPEMFEAMRAQMLAQQQGMM